MSEAKFQSCDDLYEAHRKLIDERRTNGGTDDLTSSIRSFIQKGLATGEILEQEEDRDLSRSILNYWSNILYSLAKEELYPELAPFAGEAANAKP